MTNLDTAPVKLQQAVELLNSIVAAVVLTPAAVLDRAPDDAL